MKTFFIIIGMIALGFLGFYLISASSDGLKTEIKTDTSVSISEWHDSNLMMRKTITTNAEDINAMAKQLQQTLVLVDGLMTRQAVLIKLLQELEERQ